MEEKRKKSTARASSPPGTTTSNHDNNQKVFMDSSKTREDGELVSSDEDDDFAGHHASGFPDSTTVPGEPSEVASLNRYTHVDELGKSAMASNPTNSVAVALRASMQPNQRKVSEKNRVPFVISFSDDDSGSDSEEDRQEKPIASDDMTRGVVGDRKLSTSLVTLQMVRQTAKNNTKVPKKLSMNRTFVSSMTRINGTSSRNCGTSSVGLRSNFKKSNALNKNKVGQNVHMNSTKLQDLRQLIAIRENELKSRAAKHDKKAASGSYKSSTVGKSKNAASTSKDPATECSLVEPEEREKKRLKVGEPHSSARISVHEPTQSILAADNSALESHGQKRRDSSSCCDKEILSGSGRSCATEPRERVKNDGIPSMVLPNGSRTIRNSRQHNGIGKLAEPSAQIATKTANTSPRKEACRNSPALRKGFGNTSMLRTTDMDFQSLLEIEELQDKELDEAQEHRRKCEIEERNALKAYRRAQRALAEANARCSYLYRKRELFSANLRSHMMEDSSLFWQTMTHDHVGANVNSLSNVSQDNAELVPMSSHQLQNEFDLQDQPQYDSNARSVDVAAGNFSDLHVDREGLVCEPCSEPDTSMSEPRNETEANDACSPSPEKNVSAEDKQTYEFDLKAGESSLDCHVEGTSSGRTKENDEPITFDTTEDSLRLEASLRSQLFARLGLKISETKKGSSPNMEPTIEKEGQSDVGGEVMESVENIPSSEAENVRLDDFGDIERTEKNISGHPLDGMNQGQVEKFCFNYESSSMAEPFLRTAFGHLKVPALINPLQSPTNDLQIHTADIDDGKGSDDSVCAIESTNIMLHSGDCSLVNVTSEVGSFTDNLRINPFWPLCMFELRGKCNDDECPWQHIRDYSSRHFDLNGSNSSVEPSSESGKYHSASSVSECLRSLPLVPPTYLVCLDILKADSHPYKHLLAQTAGQRWQKCFSASLVASSSFLSDLHTDEPLLHGPEARIEIHGGWNRQSSYFHGRNIKESLPDQLITDNDHAIEVALLSLSREVNKQKGRREALRVLARALEELPKSVVLWVLYLLIYYSNQKSIGKDDMFHYAVHHNEASYELWLMFINSRDKLDDRLFAYNSALLALCRHASAPHKDSERILDLFLQMMNCMCISGEVNKAIEKIYGLFHSTKRSSDLDTLFLPDIHTCLNISDKCVFWVCCVYLLMYKKLPDAIVQQFECQKELAAIEWNSVHLTASEKEQAINLMELAVDSLALHIDNKSLESKSTLRAAQHFGVNHVRCIAVLEGSECCKKLLRKYIKLYPSCLELVLLAARIKECDFADAIYEEFEEALCNWVGECGLQCVWNQYAEFALRNGRVDFAKELMERWFHSVWEVQYPESEVLNINAWISNSSQMDVVFGLLNLSLHKSLQNEHTEARIAIEQVLEVASPEEYNHCVREHAAFLLRDGSDFDKARPLRSLLDIFNSYLTDSRALPPLEPFSRSFMSSIKKPKVEQLVNNLLSPVSSDFSLLNLVLESCFGPSLIPIQASEKLTDVIEFAEAVMEIRPANYRLALSLCKMLSSVNASISFWACSLLINSLFQAVPVAPEFVWLEAAGILKNLTDIRSILEGFHKRALSVHPFSMGLWKSYLGLSSSAEQLTAVMEAAKEKGIKLG